MLLTSDETDPKRDDIGRAIQALQTGLSDAGYQKA
jgi:alanine-glyoxylate transaminase/serine-glyoxylate transaminase/serine-pyruvate transaminase